MLLNDDSGSTVRVAGAQGNRDFEELTTIYYTNVSLMPWDITVQIAPLSIVYCPGEYDDRVLSERVRQVYEMHVFLAKRDEEVVLQKRIYSGVSKGFRKYIAGRYANNQ